jgi:hypothetical protein
MDLNECHNIEYNLDKHWYDMVLFKNVEQCLISTLTKWGEERGFNVHYYNRLLCYTQYNCTIRNDNESCGIFIENYYIKHNINDLSIDNRKCWFREIDEGTYLYKIDN